MDSTLFHIALNRFDFQLIKQALEDRKHILLTKTDGASAETCTALLRLHSDADRLHADLSKGRLSVEVSITKPRAYRAKKGA